jgi:hypothetical protein
MYRPIASNYWSMIRIVHRSFVGRTADGVYAYLKLTQSIRFKLRWELAVRGLGRQPIIHVYDHPVTETKS